MRAVAIDVETQKTILNNVRGGLSGPAIKPIALRCVYDVFEFVKIPIFGCGGITDWRDAVEFFLAASSVQVGTAVGLENKMVFRAINRGIASYLKKKGYGSVKEVVGLCHQG